ncbi:MAG: type II toxin-antitoxin system HicA family toxin [Planctomycetota bacterium]
MRLPRDISGSELAKTLAQLGYEVSHQTGSHIRLTSQLGGEHHITIPAHEAIRVGTLGAILRDLGEHHQLSREELLKELFS